MPERLSVNLDAHGLSDLNAYRNLTRPQKTLVHNMLGIEKGYGEESENE